MAKQDKEKELHDLNKKLQEEIKELKSQLRTERNTVVDECVKIIKRRHYAQVFINEIETLKHH